MLFNIINHKIYLRRKSFLLKLLFLIM